MKIFPLFPARKSKPCPQIDKTQADSTVPDDLIHKTITERIEAGSDGRETVEAEIKTEPEKRDFAHRKPRETLWHAHSGEPCLHKRYTRGNRGTSRA